MNASTLASHLDYLRLGQVAENYEEMAKQAASKNWSHVEYLQRLLDCEYQYRQQRALERRIRAARFPLVKTLDQFDWSWPKKINRPQVQNLFRLAFLAQRSNAVFVGGVGIGKSHLAVALSYEACQRGHSVLFTTAIDAVNNLIAAQTTHRLKAELKRYLAPDLLCMDELGYLPLDKTGADLLFQVISQRYERGSIILTTNKAYKHWSAIFNNDSGITSAVLDRLLHHAETVIIEGKSYRTKDQPDPQT
jgi:DNA replication protein DnaC